MIFAAAVLGLGGLAAIGFTVDKDLKRVIEGTIIKVPRLLRMLAKCSLTAVRGGGRSPIFRKWPAMSGTQASRHIILHYNQDYNREEWCGE